MSAVLYLLLSNCIKSWTNSNKKKFILRTVLDPCNFRGSISIIITTTITIIQEDLVKRGFTLQEIKKEKHKEKVKLIKASLKNWKESCVLIELKIMKPCTENGSFQGIGGWKREKKGVRHASWKYILFDLIVCRIFYLNWWLEYIFWFLVPGLFSFAGSGRVISDSWFFSHVCFLFSSFFPENLLVANSLHSPNFIFQKITSFIVVYYRVSIWGRKDSYSETNCDSFSFLK